MVIQINIPSTSGGGNVPHNVLVTADCEHGTITELSTAVDHAGFHRALGKRQIMMMTFGAGIGTGLWVGTGTALRYAGPGGIAIAYTITAIIVYIQYMSIGEMTAYKPIHGGFIRQCAEYVDPAFGFAEGINFWFSWVMIIPAEITAAISVLNFWPETNVVPLAAYITIFVVVLVVANVFPVKIYGAVEYCMSFIKCFAIVVTIFFMFIMTSDGIAATHGPIEFTYRKSPGAFTNGIKGAEHIAIIAGEAIDPRRTVKKTVQPVFWRMFTFFVVNIWLVVRNLGKPFVIAIKRANVMWLAYAINGFIFLTVISCRITSVYVASRSLTALSDLKLIHPSFGRKDIQGRPYIALVISTALGVYNWFSSLARPYLSHIRFRRGLKAQGIDYKTLPFPSHGAPYLQYFGPLILLFIFGCEFYLSAWPLSEKPSAESFFASYLAVPLFIVDYYAYKRSATAQADGKPEEKINIVHYIMDLVLG
ncbi:amino acid permease/ SLC12A domain-containing protein [Delphinella strobiligena]|nr:amino acid permease/ SLC12A domain-containing protein [Delphinella strobiligena]